MATNHQVVEEALDRVALTASQRALVDEVMARPGRCSCPDCIPPYEPTPEELDELAAGPPWELALMDRCYGCDSRSAELGMVGMCPTCLAERSAVEAGDRIRERGARLRLAAGDREPESSAPLSHPSVTLDVAS